MKHSRAFTLIELILVILIMSILAVTVVPKFFDSTSIAHVAVRDQLVSLLRLSQLKAMNQLDTCNRVKITDDYIVIENNAAIDRDIEGENIDACDPSTTTGGGIETSIDTRIALDGIVITSNNATISNPFYITFDTDGISDCDCTIDIIGSETVQLKIEPQGYIHAL